jgi:hypothetical protein
MGFGAYWSPQVDGLPIDFPGSKRRVPAKVSGIKVRYSAAVDHATKRLLLCCGSAIMQP